jgi:hypothetical protein
LAASKKKKRLVPEAAAVPDAGESRGAVATTVAWMLLALSCAAAQATALVVWLIARSAGIPANRPNALMLVPSTLMFVALLSGILVLALTPVVYRVRRARPPLAVTVGAVLIAIVPLVTLAVLTIAAPARQAPRPPAVRPLTSEL